MNTPATPNDTPPDIDLATLRGVDVEAALARFVGKTARLMHWLHEFEKTAGKVPQTIRQALTDGKQEPAIAAAHSFKGHCGLLGMTSLAALAASLEASLRRHEASDDLLAALETGIADMRRQLKPPSQTSPESTLPVPQKVVWNDSYSVGVAKMDAQHQKLLGMMNGLVDCIASTEASGSPARSAASSSSAQYAEVLSAMLDYTMAHFRDEEAYLQRIAYPALATQQREHAAFIEKMVDISMQAESGVIQQTDLYLYFRDWLLGHILQSDMGYRRWMEQQPALR